MQLYLKSSHQFKSFLPPCTTVLNGTKYVCPGWHVVPMETTLEEVYKHWEKIIPKSREPEMPRGISITRMVKSSKGDKEYKVTYGPTGWNCECPGFGFRRSCRHVKELQKERV